MLYVGIMGSRCAIFQFGRGKGIDVKTFDAERFRTALDKANSSGVRCIIGMPDEGIIERAAGAVNPALFAKVYCVSRGIPYMYIKESRLRDAFKVQEGQTIRQECKMRYPDIEVRGTEQEQEDTAKAILLAEYARKYF